MRTSPTLSPNPEGYASYFPAMRLADGPETFMEIFPQPPSLQFLKSLDDLDEEEDDDDDVEDPDGEEDDFDEDEDDDEDEDEDDDEDEEDEEEDEDDDGGVKPLKM